MTETTDPDGRMDGPIHAWFSLTYSNYLVLHRSMMQSMPVDWQARAVALFDELDQAYAHLERPQAYIVQPARESIYIHLSEAEMQALFYDRDGVEHEPFDRLLVPTGADPIPHYNRGRTFLPPVLGDQPEEPQP